MWLYLNDAFLSMVSDRNDPDRLLVRARRKGDIEAVFPDAAVDHTPTHDYPYRARVERHEVAASIADRLAAIDYPNFKDSVRDPYRHAVYAQAWADSMRLSSRSDRAPASCVRGLSNWMAPSSFGFKRRPSSMDLTTI